MFETAQAPPRHAPQLWPWPSRPWTRLHLDFLGPIGGHRYLIIIDACSKWIEVYPMKCTSASVVISKLREVCSRFGIPRQIVSDNGPPFTSDELKIFMRHNGIQHIFSAPYHPASNGAAENAVKICKRVIIKSIKMGLNTEVALQRYLLMYRNTEHSTTGESPAALLLGRCVRTRLDRLKPSREQRVQKAQERQERAAGGGHRALRPGDAVWYRAYSGPTKWLDGIIEQAIGQTDYNIKSRDGAVVHRHIDQIKLICKNSEFLEQTQGTNGRVVLGLPQWPVGSTRASSGPVAQVTTSDLARVDGVDGSGQPESSVGPSAGERRYPLRERRPPSRFGDSTV